jgi:alpha-glucosidase
MQWNGQPNGGFSEAKPWLPLADDYREINVAVQQQDLSGMLNLYRSIIAYRRRSLALRAGSYRAVAANAQDCFVYLREYGTIKIMIALNFTDEPQILNLSTFNHGRVILSTHLDRAEAIDVSSFQLRANEGCIIEL